MKTFTLFLSAAFLFLMCGCHRPNASEAKTDQEFGSALAEAFKNGDSTVFSRLNHPETSGYLEYMSGKRFEKVLNSRPEKVKVSLITLAEVGFDLPGSMAGKRLRFTSPVDGVVHLIGTSSKSSPQATIELFIPFLKQNDRYYIPPVDFDPAFPVSERR